MNYNQTNPPHRLHFYPVIPSRTIGQLALWLGGLSALALLTACSSTHIQSARIAAVRASIGRVIFGQDEVVDQTLITLLSGGHVLLVGVPGLGKSRLVETLGVVLGYRYENSPVVVRG